MARDTYHNRLREKAILISRAFKAVLFGVPERFLARLATRWILRWLFLGPDGKPHRAGRIVLRDLGQFCGATNKTIFHADPHQLARREGRREVFVRICIMLNLDEYEVRKLMELDDGQ
ncbi:MAG: hypothetical protein B7Y36_08255 [Novosphingobium sp. 28-62-57]|uniref:Bbp19 family protein n=1 Tax=unclassified Novosphingobium TaxID=2644732 RepID=UPI000BCE5963|nr:MULTISPECIES: hypothetical protein [unclassified Novosphingobium]OYW47917.1 MAG: hypothetical protein B7Z36_01350 [Novosphingobium sp. 12-63-9]OYZ10808.1 MAG: hypothetical protein B7Y36_08255 [Novosphingobium sp. 28-62-57]OZA36948.1 MAG: hypothetical protein B7X92_05390 [Novosphingobium sp. 17-62-9]HQS69737.1 hypothetical protein [Novosphingobium sp.]